MKLNIKVVNILFLTAIIDVYNYIRQKYLHKLLNRVCFEYKAKLLQYRKSKTMY